MIANSEIGRIKKYGYSKESFLPYMDMLKLYFDNNNIEEKNKARMDAKVHETLSNLVMPSAPEHLSFNETEKLLLTWNKLNFKYLVQRFKFWKR